MTRGDVIRMDAVYAENPPDDSGPRLTLDEWAARKREAARPTPNPGVVVSGAQQLQNLTEANKIITDLRVSQIDCNPIWQKLFRVGLYLEREQAKTLREILAPPPRWSWLQRSIFPRVCKGLDKC